MDQLRSKIDNIVLIKQYRVGHGLSQSQQLISEPGWRDKFKNTKIPFDLCIGDMCGRDQVIRSWKLVVGHEMNVVFSLKRRMWDIKQSCTLEN